MKELLKRLNARPGPAWQVAVASLVINVLSLASPVFVITILNTYIAGGTNRTLITLCAGMALALVLLACFRSVRVRLGDLVFSMPDQDLTERVVGKLKRLQAHVLDGAAKGLAVRAMDRVHTVASAFAPSQIMRLMDAPFALVFLGVAAYFSIPLALIGLVGVLLAHGASRWALARTVRLGGAVRDSGARQRLLMADALSDPDTLFAFGGDMVVEQLARDKAVEAAQDRDRVALSRGLHQTVSMVSVMVVSVALYAVGAVFVVQGRLSVGALIGVNILVSMACRSATGVAGSWAALKEADQAMADLDSMLRLPEEPDAGAAMGKYSGSLACRDLAFVYPGATRPVFESLNLSLGPGQVVVVHGPNGSGKTTLARLIMGLLLPSRGEILIDGLNQRQANPRWWRGQAADLPQEPSIFPGTLRENIVCLNPDLDEPSLGQVINDSGLARFVFAQPRGLAAELPDAGQGLPKEVRQSLALARVLATVSPLAVLDEPCQGRDPQAMDLAHGAMKTMHGQGRSQVIFTHEPQAILDLLPVSLVMELGAAAIPELRTPAKAEREKDQGREI